MSLVGYAHLYIVHNERRQHIITHTQLMKDLHKFLPRAAPQSEHQVRLVSRQDDREHVHLRSRGFGRELHPGEKFEIGAEGRPQLRFSGKSRPSGSVVPCWLIYRFYETIKSPKRMPCCCCSVTYVFGSGCA